MPVVIVSAEESIAAVPRGMRRAPWPWGIQVSDHCRIVLPAALPGILTGVILAMARGAGEVAPLMITGVVKLAPELPFDGLFPYFHLDRKFMHLGFHIYDVGFQSPNVEAAKPMVFTTTLLLIAIVVRSTLRRSACATGSGESTRPGPSNCTSSDSMGNSSRTHASSLHSRPDSFALGRCRGPAYHRPADRRGPDVKVEELSLFYGTNQALHDISLDIPAKQVTAFIGPSGCGKMHAACAASTG